ncbi:hypothetical protein Bca52824_077775 [Brassica carinata]|uniref:Uncharacterized protein n=1 Tax=Brassica carinata TaxID=52824 RepID=A0A8X7TZ20_BRACI|nr:hypothetical protein Bca52824_077775 [Brassica carinata]
MIRVHDTRRRGRGYASSRVERFFMRLDTVDFVDKITVESLVEDLRNRDSDEVSLWWRIIHEVRGKDDHDTLPGKRFFTARTTRLMGCIIVNLGSLAWRSISNASSVEEVEVLIKFVPEVNYKIQRLEGDVQALTREVDSLIEQFYNLFVQVADLEKLARPRKVRVAVA